MVICELDFYRRYRRGAAGGGLERRASETFRPRPKLPVRPGAAHIKSTGSIADRRSAGRTDFKTTIEIFAKDENSVPVPARTHCPPPGEARRTDWPPPLQAAPKCVCQRAFPDILRGAFAFGEQPTGLTLISSATGLPLPHYTQLGRERGPKTGFLRAKPLGGGLGRRSLPTSPPQRGRPPNASYSPYVVFMLKLTPQT